jgi:hypothetical protein
MAACRQSAAIPPRPSETCHDRRRSSVSITGLVLSIVCSSASPGRVGTAGTPRHLSQHLETPLGGTQITAGQPEIGIDNPDQRQIREMVTLCRHLRADDDIHLAIDNRTDKALGAAGVATVSLEKTANRASGKRCSTSSARRSTPGPQACMLSSSPHSTQPRCGRAS